MNLEDFIIKSISAQETFLVRHPILRAGRPIIDCEFEGDNLNSTLHLGLFFKKKLIGVATFIKNSNTLFSGKEQYQLRGMAILEKFQKQGLGYYLLQEGENQLADTCNCIWFNAREIAVTFYQSNGYKIASDPFIIKDVGIHFVMVKNFIK